MSSRGGRSLWGDKRGRMIEIKFMAWWAICR